MVNLDAEFQKIETLNSADRPVIDTIAGTLSRIFVGLEETDAELRLHRERIRAFERRRSRSRRAKGRGDHNPATPETAPMGKAEGQKVAVTTTRQHRRQRQWAKPRTGSGAMPNGEDRD
jgi:hypothetical protein